MPTLAPPPLWHYRARCEWARRRWQALARGWRLVDEPGRAALCQQMADYWALPFWRQLLAVWAAAAVARQLRQPYEHSVKT